MFPFHFKQITQVFYRIEDIPNLHDLEPSNDTSHFTEAFAV